MALPGLRDPVLVDPNARKAANTCLHCRRLLRDAHQTDDGVRLCKTCLHEILRKPGGTCECCSVTVEDGKYYPDKAAQREVNKLTVICCYQRLGCPWQDQFQLYEAHVSSCPYAGVACPNEGCPELLPSHSLGTHKLVCEYRRVQCTFCVKNTTARDMEAHLATECPSHPVTCQRCGYKVPERQQLLRHHLTECKIEECLVCGELVHRDTSNNCSHTHASAPSDPRASEPPRDLTTPSKRYSLSVGTTEGGSAAQKGLGRGDLRTLGKERTSEHKKFSPFDSVSLKTETEREFLSSHAVDIYCHLRDPLVVFRHTQSLAEKQGDMERELLKFKDLADTQLSSAGQNTSSMREVVARMEEKIRSLTGELEREREGREEVGERLQQLNNELLVSGRRAQQAESRLADVEKLVQSHSQEIIGVKQLAGKAGGGYGVGAKGGGGAWEGVGGGDFGSRGEMRLSHLEQRLEQLERQSSSTKVHISELELQLQASLASTHNGSFLWRIPEIARRRRDAIEERITSIYSPPFYTGRNGYKMCIRAYLNGDGIGYKTHLSVFFVLMKGEFDPLLKWPFEYKVSLILVDQDHRKHIVQTFKPTPDSSSFKKPHNDMNVASGCPQFAKLSVLEEQNYTKGDVIYLKCIVDTSRIFHP